MFESVVASLINRLLGEYLANLSTDQLSVGVISGNVELFGLKLKPDALQQLNLPIEVVEGHLGELRLQIPWTSLRSKPVILHIKDLCVLAGPRSKFMYDPAREVERALRTKLSKLETYELVLSSAQSVAVKDENKTESFFAHLTSRVISNIQITIENVHIRYEDDASKAFGVRVERLVANSTDSAWQAAFIAEGPIYKLTQLEGLSMYFDVDADNGWDQQTEDVVEYLSSKTDNRYILRPITTDCKLIFQQRYSSDVPKATLSLEIPAIQLAMAEGQYNSILRILENFLLLENSLKYLSVRQECPLDSFNRLQYAVACVRRDVQEQVSKRSISFLAQRRKDRLAYIENFLAPKSKATEDVLRVLEGRLDLKDIILFRSMARLQAKQRSVGAAEGQQKNQSYLGWAASFFYASGSNAESTVKESEKITQQDVAKIYEIIDFNESTASVNLKGTIPRSYVTLKSTIVLQQLDLTIEDDSGQTLFSACFERFLMDFVKRPKNVELSMSMGNLSVKEGMLANSLYPTIVKKRSTSPQVEEKPLLEIGFSDYYEVPNEAFDSRLSIRAEPLEIVYNHQAFGLVKGFMDSHGGVIKKLLVRPAEKTLSRYVSQTRSVLEAAIISHKAIDLDIDMLAPVLILPISCTDRQDSIFAVDLGRLCGSSQFASPADRKRALEQSDVNGLYDLLKLHITEASILFSTAFNDELDKFDGFVRDLDIAVDFLDTFLTKRQRGDMVGTIVNCRAKPVHLFFSDFKFKQFMRLFDILKPPELILPVEKTTFEPQDSQGEEEEFFDPLETPLEDVESLEHPKVKVNMVFDNIQLSAFKQVDMSDDSSFLMKTEVGNLYVGVQVASKIVDVDVSLQKFLLNDANVSILAAKDPTSAILNVHVRLVDLDHPLFAMQYQSAKYHVDLELAALTLGICPKDFVEDVQYVLNTFVEDDPRRMAAIPFQPIATKKLIRGVLKEVDILIIDDADKKTGRGELTIADAGLDIVFEPVENVVKLDICTCKMLNRAPIPSESTSAPFFEIINDKLHLEYRFSDEPLYGNRMGTTQLRVKSGNPVIVWMPQFLEDLLVTFNVLKTIKPPPTDRPVEATRLLYEFQLESPILKFLPDPDNSEALEGVVLFYFGNCEAGNRFEPLTSPKGQANQIIECALNALHCSILPSASQQPVGILKPANVDIACLQLFRANDQGRANNQVTVKCDGALEFALTKPMYTLFLDQVMFFLGTVNQAVVPLIGPPLPFYDPAAKKAIHTTSLQWDLPGIHLAMLDCDSRLFARLSMEECTYLMDTWSNVVMKISFPVKRFIVEERAMDQSAFPVIVTSAADVPFAITYDRNEKLEADIKFSMTDWQVIFYVDLARTLHGYIILGWPRPRPPRKGVQLSPQGPPQHTISELVNTRLYLVADKSHVESEALLVTVGIFLYGLRGVDWTLDAGPIGACLCNMNDPDGDANVLDIMEPLGLRARSLTSVADSHHHTTSETTLQVDPINFFLSYEDLMFVLEIARQLQPSSPSDVSSSHPDSSNNPNSLDNSNSPSNQGPPSATPSRGDIMPSTMEIVAQEFVRRSSFRLDSFRVSLIDDVFKTNIPFADIAVEDIQYESVNKSDLEMSSHGSMRLMANYFNLDNSHWEPLLEPCTLELTSQPQGGGETSLVFTTPVNFSLTSKFLAALSEISSRISKNVSPRLSAIRKVTQPYQITNQTGYRLNVWADGVKDGLDMKELKDGDSLPWSFSHWKDSRKTRHGSSANMLAVHILDSEWETLRALPVDLENYYEVLLRPVSGDPPVVMVVEVAISKRIKEIIFRSPIAICNLTHFPLQLKLVGRERDLEYVVEPDSTRSLPLSNLHAGLFRLRPTGQGYEYSHKLLPTREFFVPQPLTHTYDTLYVNERCLNADEQVAPFHFVACNRTDKADSNRSLTSSANRMSRKQWRQSRKSRFDDCHGTIFIEAPLDVVNLLPYDVKFRAYDVRAGIDFGGSIAAGSSAPLHAVDNTHALGFSLEIGGTDWQSVDVANINAPSGSRDEVDGTVVLRNSAGTELHLSTRVVGSAGKGGRRTLHVYAPFVVLNRTMLDVELIAATCFKRDDQYERKAVFWSQPSLDPQVPSGPLLFSFSDRDNSRGKVRLRAACSSQWSKPMSLETLGSMTPVHVQNVGSLSWYNLTVTVTAAPTSFFGVKLIKIAPMFMVSSELTTPVFIRAGDDCLVNEVPAKANFPLHLDPAKLNAVRLSLDGLKWSASFGVAVAGRDVVKAQREVLVGVDRELSRGTWFLRLTREDKWPLSIVNSTSFDLDVCQKGFAAVHKYRVPPNSTLPFAWEEPFAGENILTLDILGKQRQVNPQELGQLLPLAVRDPVTKERRNLSIDVRAQGPHITVHLAHYDSKTSLYHQRRPSSPTEETKISTEGGAIPDVSTMSLNPTNLSSNAAVEEFEEKSVASAVARSYVVRIPYLGVSLVSDGLEELVYLTARGVEYRYTLSNIHVTHGLTIGWLQLDNQSLDWSVPILFYPTNLAKYVAADSNAAAGDAEEELLPFLKLAVIQFRDEQTFGLRCYRYVGLVVQECSVELTEDIVRDLVTLASSSLSAMPHRTAMYDPADDAVPPRLLRSALEVPSYFEVFQVHPMRVSFSYGRTEKANSSSTGNNYGTTGTGISPINATVEIFSMALGQVSNAEFRFNSLTLENCIINRRLLGLKLVENYRREVFGQLHRLIGSADVLGNPAGLFHSFASGVTDLFYEPYQGFVSDRPQDFGLGLARGTASLVRHTVYGLSDTLSKFTGSIGRGMSMVTLDSRFQRQRRLQRARNRPRHALAGITAGARQFVSGVTSGVAGLLEKPVELTRREGATGFFKGVGLGVVGVFVKPLLGAVDLATSLTEGIRGSAEGWEFELLPARLPRPVPWDGILRVYSPYEAFGQSILIAARQHQNSLASPLRSERYVYHVEQAEQAVLVTTRKLLAVRLGSKRILWSHRLDEVVKLQAVGANSLLVEATYRHESSKTAPSASSAGSGDLERYAIGDVVKGDCQQLVAVFEQLTQALFKNLAKK